MIRIIGTRKGKTECLDSADTWQEAYRLIFEYRMAYGSKWVIDAVLA